MEERARQGEGRGAQGFTMSQQQELFFDLSTAPRQCMRPLTYQKHLAFLRVGVLQEIKHV